MKPHRKEKLESLIQEELSKLMVREFDFGGVLVTITKVEMDSDLTHAKVYLGVIPHKAGIKIFAEVERKRKELQYSLLKKMTIRVMPSIRFLLGGEDLLSG